MPTINLKKYIKSTYTNNPAKKKVFSSLNVWEKSSVNASGPGFLLQKKINYVSNLLNNYRAFQ